MAEEVGQSGTGANTRLGACKDCGGVVSLLAVTCPHCGRPRPVAPKAEKKEKVQPTLLARFVALICIFGVPITLYFFLAEYFQKGIRIGDLWDYAVRAKPVPGGQKKAAVFGSEYDEWKAHTSPNTRMTFLVGGRKDWEIVITRKCVADDLDIFIASKGHRNQDQPVYFWFDNEGPIEFRSHLVSDKGYQFLPSQEETFVREMKACTRFRVRIGGKTFAAENIGFSSAFAKLCD